MDRHSALLQCACDEGEGGTLLSLPLNKVLFLLLVQAKKSTGLESLLFFFPAARNFGLHHLPFSG